MKAKPMLTPKAIAEQKGKLIRYEQAVDEAAAEWAKRLPKLPRQLAAEEKIFEKRWSENKASREFFKAFNAAVKGPKLGPLLESDPVTGKPRATDAFFCLAARIFSGSALKCDSSESRIHNPQATVLAFVKDALRTGNAEFFEKLARAIRAHNHSGRPHEANVLWLAKEVGIYPPDKVRINTILFRQRYKERFGLVIDTRHLRRICKKQGILLLSGEPGRPKTRTAEK